MRAHFWSADQGGSAYYRGVLPATGLGWLGHTVTQGARAPKDARAYDVVFGARVALPGPSLLWSQLRDAGVRLVMDLDDDYWHIDDTSTEARRFWDRDMLDRLARNTALADTVACCSEPLAAALREFHDDVRVIPNGLPAQWLAPLRDYRPDTVTVGWAGTPSTVYELPLAARALNRISTYQPQAGSVEVLLVGPWPVEAKAAGVRGEGVQTTGWVDGMDRYLASVNAFDVWVAPYRDTPFNRCKAPTKAIEAGFLGIPIVASAIAPYADAVVHGETGYLVPVGREHLFGRYIRRLVDDPDLRQRMGQAARAKASGLIMQALNQQWEKVAQQ